MVDDAHRNPDHVKLEVIYRRLIEVIYAKDDLTTSGGRTGPERKTEEAKSARARAKELSSRTHLFLQAPKFDRC